MPAGVPWPTYLKTLAASLLAMLAGAEVVHRYYGPDLVSAAGGIGAGGGRAGGWDSSGSSRPGNSQPCQNRSGNKIQAPLLREK